jgi:hypothetical protein
MKIPDVTPTDLTKNIIGLLIVVVWLLMTYQGLEIPTLLEVTFIAVMSAYGISVSKPVVSNALSRLSVKPQDGKPAQ